MNFLPFLGNLATIETKGRIAICALIVLLVLTFYFTNKYHTYKEQNIEMQQQIVLLDQEIKSANAQRDFAYFQVEQNKEMQQELIDERDRIKNKYANILDKNKELKDDYISEKLVGILNGIEEN